MVPHHYSIPDHKERSVSRGFQLVKICTDINILILREKPPQHQPASTLIITKAISTSFVESSIFGLYIHYEY